MNLRANSSDFLDIFLHDTPLMDVRAPVEFNRGAFPTSQNIPLLDDEQRTLVGTRYKKAGQDQAIALGNELATPAIKTQHIKAWQSFTQAKPEGLLYCFRGGLRSRVTQQWLKESGINYPYIEGGYKAMRTYLIEQLQASLNTVPVVLISGKTASGKTHLLHSLSRHIDLEGLANHRGSSFGAQVTAQPSQIDFENSLSINLLKQKHQHNLPVFMEDEGHLIGQVVITSEMCTAMKTQYPIAILDTPMVERVQIGIKDYITELLPKYQSVYGDQAHDIFSEKILFNLSRIKRRLGGDFHSTLHSQFTDALNALANGDASGFAQPIETLLSKYYDPMYDYQLQKREGRMLIRGTREELLHWAEHYRV
ncbi:MAG: tRNA 2-selenouridine synthase [Lentisphaeria bacterium]|jgi:tRNA 2-selenouridine synthase